MTKIIRNLCTALSCAAIGLFAVSCNDDKSNDLPEGTLYDIVTLVSNNDNGTVFEFQKEGDSPMITLTSTRRVDSEIFKTGDRMLIAYLPLASSYASGPIELEATGQVINGDIIEGKASDWNSFRTYDQYLTFISRSGQYINVRSELYVRSAPKTYSLVVDEATLDQEYPTAYIIFIPDNEMDATLHTGYASWDISKVWNLPTVKGLKIRLSNTNGDNEFTFKKDTPQIEPAE